MVAASDCPFCCHARPDSFAQMTRLTRLLGLTLAFVLVLTSQQMAQARGLSRDAAGQVVLCTGQGLVTVTVDHRGTPVETVNFCPDCMLSFLALTPAETGVLTDEFKVTTLRQVFGIDWKFGLTPKHAQARAPPVLA